MTLAPKYGDPDNTLLFKIASLLNANGGGGGTAGVISFNTRTGVVTLTSGDVTSALGFTPADAAALANYLLLTGGTINGNLVVTNGFIDTFGFLAHEQSAIVNAGPVAGEFYHDSTSGTPTTNNGVSVDYTADTATVKRQIAGRTLVDWSNATDATRSSRFRIFLENSAAFAEVLRISPAATSLFIGNLLFTDNTQDIGASGATRPRSIFAGTSVTSPVYKVDAGNINAQTGTTYTLDATDNGKVVTLSNAGAITLTVPSGLGVGFTCTLIQLGAGQVTVAASGVTLNSYTSLVKIAGQHGAATLYAYVADVFNLSGNLA